MRQAEPRRSVRRGMLAANPAARRALTVTPSSARQRPGSAASAGEVASERQRKLRLRHSPQSQGPQQQQQQQQRWQRRGGVLSRPATATSRPATMSARDTGRGGVERVLEIARKRARSRKVSQVLGVCNAMSEQGPVPRSPSCEFGPSAAAQHGDESAVQRQLAEAQAALELRQEELEEQRQLLRESEAHRLIQRDRLRRLEAVEKERAEAEARRRAEMALRQTPEQQRLAGCLAAQDRLALEQVLRDDAESPSLMSEAPAAQIAKRLGQVGLGEVSPDETMAAAAAAAAATAAATADAERRAEQETVAKRTSRLGQGYNTFLQPRAVLQRGFVDGPSERFPLSAYAGQQLRPEARPPALCLKCGALCDRELRRYKRARAVGFRAIFERGSRRQRLELRRSVLRHCLASWRQVLRAVKRGRATAERLSSLRAQRCLERSFARWSTATKRRILTRLRGRAAAQQGL